MRILFLFMIFIISCKSRQQNQIGSLKNPNVVTNTIDCSQSQHESSCLKPILKKIAIKPIQYEGLMIPMIEIEESENLLYIKILACPKGKPCLKEIETPFQQFLYPGLPSGSIDFAVRGCRGTHCTEAVKAMFLQAPSDKEKLAQLLHKKTLKEQEFNVLGKSIYESMKEFSEAKKICEDQELEKIFSQKVLDQYLATGPHFIALGLQRDEAQIIIEGKDGEEVIYLDAAEYVLPGHGREVSTTETADKIDRTTSLENSAIMIVVSGLSIVLLKGTVDKGAKVYVKTWKDVQNGVKAKKTDVFKPKTRLGLLTGFSALVVGAGVYMIYSNKDQEGKVLTQYVNTVSTGMLTLSEDPACAKAREQLVAIQKQDDEAATKRDELHLILSEIEKEIGP